MVQMIVRIIPARIVSHPLAVVMHVRRFRVALIVSETMIIAGVRLTALGSRDRRWSGMRRRSPGRHKSAAHMPLAASGFAALLFAVLRHRREASQARKKNAEPQNSIDSH
jgi:hypothetical protein